LSRIGKKLIPIPSGVSLKLKGDIYEIKGPKGTLEVKFIDGIEVEIKGNEAHVINKGGVDSKLYKSMHGLVRSLLANAIHGVSEGFVKQMDLQGVGYRAEVKPDGLSLQIGFSHPIFMEFPEGISAEIEKGSSVISIMGIDKQKVGQYCADVRKLRPPEPYKGKGFRYIGEHVRRKSGKSV
jgi:large subunit ribosomal protein L6